MRKYMSTILQEFLVPTGHWLELSFFGIIGTPYAQVYALRNGKMFTVSIEQPLKN